MKPPSGGTLQSVQDHVEQVHDLHEQIVSINTLF